MIEKFNLYMPPFDEERRIHLYLPDDWREAGRCYPVLYMFDGHNLFEDSEATYGTSWHLADTIQKMHKELIVVGQECSHVGDNRISEYSPFDFEEAVFKKEPVKGQGDRTMQFFVQTLKPYIDAHYPTLRDRRFTWIGGSSCGGTMAYFAGIRHSAVFSKAVCVSPFIAPMYEQFLQLTKETVISPDTAFYLSWGAKENGDHLFVYETKMCTELANRLIEKNFPVYFNVKPSGRHCEADWSLEVPEILKFLFHR